MSDSGWEQYPHGIELCRYAKKSLGYGACIRVGGVTTELPYGTHIAVADLAAEVDRLRSLVKTMLDNDPNEPIADSGETVFCLWRYEARRQLGLNDEKISEPQVFETL